MVLRDKAYINLKCFKLNVSPININKITLTIGESYFIYMIYYYCQVKPSE